MSSSSQRTRVLLIGPSSPPVGGMASVVEAILHSRLGERFAFTHLDTRLGERQRRSHILRFLESVSWSGRLVAACFRGVDVAHVHTSSYLGYFEKALFCALLRVAGVPTLLHVHGGGFGEFVRRSGRLRHFLIRVTLGFPSAIMCLSESWARLFVGLVPTREVLVLSNAVDVSVYDPSLRDAARRRLAIDSDCVLGLFVGEVREGKGSYDIVRALEMAKECRGRLKVVFLGPGQVKELSEAAEARGVSDLVISLGPRSGDDRWPIFAAADFFILPSHIEGLPVALLEAMAWGLPSIVSSVGAIPEVVEEGVTGLFVRPGNADEISAAILKLVSDRENMRVMGAQARRQACEKWSSELFEQQLAVEYDLLASRPRGGGRLRAG